MKSPAFETETFAIPASQKKFRSRSISPDYIFKITGNITVKSVTIFSHPPIFPLPQFFAIRVRKEIMMWFKFGKMLAPQDYLTEFQYNHPMPPGKLPLAHKCCTHHLYYIAHLQLQPRPILQQQEHYKQANKVIIILQRET